MTDAADEQAERFRKGQRQFMIGAGLVMFGMIFGGGLAMVFYFLGQRTPGMFAGLAGAAVVLVGIFIQGAGAKQIKSKGLALLLIVSALLKPPLWVAAVGGAVTAILIWTGTAVLVIGAMLRNMRVVA
jgi:hypothetical protein